MTKTRAVFQRARMSHQRVGDAVVLDALRLPGATAQVFFAVGPSARDITAAGNCNLLGLRSIGEAVIATLTPAAGAEAPLLRVAGSEAPIALRHCQQDLFDGLNTACTIRNGESAALTLEWLRYHARHHGLQAVLMLDRARPGTAEDFAAALEAGAAGIEGLERLVWVQCDRPLGLPDLPPEQHPFNAPDAPGKDRMDLPEAAPWESPLGQKHLYEWARVRFLDRARAVAQLDISDLLPPHGDRGTVFDRAVASRSGAILLAGRHCYPWRVRKGAEAGFADHICVQFDASDLRRRWCVAPARTSGSTVWRYVRIVGAEPDPDEWAPFYRCMALRHPTDTVSRIVPKTSLVEDAGLLALAESHFDHKPVRMPEIAAPRPDPTANRTAIVTCMKNEGPFILEWLAYHRAIGVSEVLVYTNDCSDGTDALLDLLQRKGIVQHRDNPFRQSGLKPQHAALQAAEQEDIIRTADWVISMDVDEFINIKTGDGRLADLFAAMGDANMISCTWRLFGNSDIDAFADSPLIEQFTRCAEEITRKPHQAWGFKTLFRNIGLFKKLGVHRPKGLNPQLWDQIRWVNGSGQPLPREMYRNAWRSTSDTVGYDLVQLNHYAVRSAESFLVKRDRGRVNHVDRDQGLAYWFRMNNNATTDRSIQRMLPALRAELQRLMADPEIAEAHAFCVDRHRDRIAALKQMPRYREFHRDLTGARLRKLARMHRVFGANVFLAGPDAVPDEIIERDHPEGAYFTVKKGETAH